MSDIDSSSEPDTSPPAHADWPKTLEWIEKQAQESLKARYATAELIAKETQTTLTVLLAGVGGSAAYGIKIFESGPLNPLSSAAAAVCIYLVVLSIILVVKCMMFKSYPALYQDPENLMQPEHSLNEVREAEVRNIGERITEAKSINDARAIKLNKLRIAVVVSPFIFAGAAWLSPPQLAPSAEKTTVVCKVESTGSNAPPALRCVMTK